MQILDSHGQPCDDAYHDVLSHYQGIARADDRSGPCDDDYESSAPFIDGMPEEEDVFLSRPLRFSSDHQFQIDEYNQRCADEALFNALFASDVDALFRRQRSAR